MHREKNVRKQLDCKTKTPRNTQRKLLFDRKMNWKWHKTVATEYKQIQKDRGRDEEAENASHLSPADKHCVIEEIGEGEKIAFRSLQDKSKYQSFSTPIYLWKIA